MYFYLFIAISFYLNIVRKNFVCELGLNPIHKENRGKKDRGGLFRIRELRHTLFRQKATVTLNLTSTKKTKTG